MTVETLTQLDDYDVVHIDTHGGTLCKKKELLKSAGAEKGKDKQKCEDGVTDFLVQRFHGTAADLQGISHPGVVHYRGRLHQSIAVTADFFRHYYPNGLADTVFILGSCNTFRTDMAQAIAGDRGMYLSWDRYTEYSLVKNTSLALLDGLGQGLTVGEAFARLPSFSPENPDAGGSQFRYTERGVGGDLRIRNLMTVRDVLTGEVVTNTSGIEVDGVPGDGANDGLQLEFTIDGIAPERLADFFVNLVVNDNVIGHLELAKSGVQVGDFSYQVTTPVPLPFDVQEGQALSMDFWIPLPDRGEDHYQAAPKVTARATPQIGREWRLNSTTTVSRVDDRTIKTADITFVLDPDQNPQSAFQRFVVKSGSVRIQREYEDALGCRFVVDETLTIPANASSTSLTFDLSGGAPVVDGFGSVASETVQVSGSCGDTRSLSVGGVYFMAEEAAVTGSSFQGGYNDGAAFPTVITWQLTKVE